MALLTVPPKPPVRNKRRSRSSEPQRTFENFQTISETLSMSVLDDNFEHCVFKKTARKYNAPQCETSDPSSSYPPLYFTMDDFESVTNPLKKNYHLSLQKFLNTMLLTEQEELSSITKVPKTLNLDNNNVDFNSTKSSDNTSWTTETNNNNMLSSNDDVITNNVGPRKVRFNDQIYQQSSIDNNDNANDSNSNECSLSTDNNESDISVFYVQVERLWGSFGIQIEEIHFEDESQLIVSAVLPRGAADLTGNIFEGDRILEIDKKPVSDLESATKQLQSASDAVLLRLVRRLSSVNNHDTIEQEQQQPPTNHPIANHLNIMGANVSRHSGKGLSGRRTQSSGNICNRKPSSNVTRLLGSCATTDAVLTPCQQTANNTVVKGYRFCGSLPNHLDDTDSIHDSDNNTTDNNNHVTTSNQIAKVATYIPKKHHAPPIPTLQTYRRCDPDVELRLQPLHVKIGNDTGLCDQGYGSERSPEDEYAPQAMVFGVESDDIDLYTKYPFISPESIFTVTLTKNSRGLGLSVTGGIDCTGPWPGLVRVKRLFPNQPAATCGLLSTGDLILAANGLTLTGLTNYEALEVLRTTPSSVVLTVCRPPPEILSAVSPLSDIPPPPPRRDPPCSINLLSGLTPYEDCYNGEFDITLTKVQGSLGFTLRKEDESALGHYVRALVREPALSDGRIKPGDKIVAVNDVELSSLSHEEAVQFLRQCGQEVKLRLYRDAAQTPVAALSPTEPDAPLKLKPLRQEAVDMLSDLAVRKLSPCNNPPPSIDDTNWRRSKEDLSVCNTNSTPRRLRRTQRTTPDSEYDGNLCPDEKGSYKYLSSQLTSESDSFSRNASFGSDNNNANMSSNESESDRPIRPNFLNLGGTSSVTSSSAPPLNRKPKFQFSLAHNAYELNNLDADVLDAPNLTFSMNKSERYDEIDPSSCQNDMKDMSSDEPVSMPPISTKSGGFNHKNPSYQSAHPKCGTAVNEVSGDSTNITTATESGTKGLLKWKGVVFTPESDSNADEQSRNNIIHAEDSDFEIITVELNRGWNSRLGFSLQQGNSGETFISAVHSDSVAAKDGRLQPGDQLLRVNDENVENMTTNNVIDLLRIVRGPVSIVIARKII